MNKKNFIQVFEFQKLRYTDETSFKEHHFEAMVKFNEKNQNKYFTIIHKGVQFNNYVGVIQIGGLTVEILPKADNNDNADANLWQGVLLNMLRVCKHINVANISETALKKRYNSILEIYYEMYLNEVEDLIKKGLIKKYKRVQSNQLALKGKIIFAKNIQKNLVHGERFYCEHQIYDRDHLFHNIIFKGLKVLSNLIKDSLRDKLNRILYEFMDFKEINITSQHFEKLSFNRKSNSYKKAIDIAKMLILNYSPNLNTGKDNMLTLLFDMNILWEEFIFRTLQRHKPDNFSVSFQNKKNFWTSIGRTKTIRPDIVIVETKNDSDVTYILDTKWKIRDTNNPDDGDLKQMFAYNLYWGAEKSILLFPKIKQEDSEYGSYHVSLNPVNQNQCKLGFINIISDNNLSPSKKIAEEILYKLN
ncbi:McrC family protein [Seonamhaeicola aphaedonensis]|uniref:5-methylcytosine-specific restriction enzyme subunit McrC n=1 Tax=Seonamhaeicola aphaedonensis TaxID=1461338 RepID=A0A3D9HH20_9FLAO|nr:restriction endonuclease [Seonamhaeicola aphaedonensis]RED48809.1 5-methylcytosine-specific restriction enzyme subunit McrC [Seonamhaeicola aphaedonensis]